MSQLFIRLFLDEDVDVLLATLVRARGFEAVTTSEAKRLGATDAEQMEFAATQRLSLLTHNRADFEQLARQWLESGRHHAGLIIGVRRRPHDILRRLLPVLNHVTADEMEDQVRYV